MDWMPEDVEVVGAVEVAPPIVTDELSPGMGCHASPSRVWDVGEGFELVASRVLCEAGGTYGQLTLSSGADAWIVPYTPGSPVVVTPETVTATESLRSNEPGGPYRFDVVYVVDLGERRVDAVRTRTVVREHGEGPRSRARDTWTLAERGFTWREPPRADAPATHAGSMDGTTGGLDIPGAVEVDPPIAEAWEGSDEAWRLPFVAGSSVVAGPGMLVATTSWQEPDDRERRVDIVYTLDLSERRIDAVRTVTTVRDDGSDGRRQRRRDRWTLDERGFEWVRDGSS